MKKKQYERFSVERKQRTCTRRIRNGCLAVVWMVCLIGPYILHANTQEQKLTVKLQNVKLEQAIAQLQRDSKSYFLFNNTLVNLEQRVSVDKTNESLPNILNAMLQGTGIQYKIDGTHVILYVNTPSEAANTIPATAERSPASQPAATRAPQVNTQQRTITVHGTVTDDTGPLPGAAVMVKNNLQKNTTTDVNGKFTLLDVNSDATLVVSFLGYETIEVPVAAGRELTVKMNATATAMDEVVVFGYGSNQKIRDVTGSISHVGTKDIQVSAMGSTVSSLLQGRAAGVNVQIQSASPTSPISVIIRGQSSLSGNNQPLWVIDGIPEYNSGVSGSISNVLYSLNLNDIESIDILKDASSTAIYGSRAANGVIVVTTKSGKEGMDPIIEFSARLGIQKANFNSYQYFTAKDYINFADKANRKEVYNHGAFDASTRKYLDEQAFFNLNTSEINPDKLQILPGAYYEGDTDWTKEVTQSPLMQQYDLSLRGGSKAVSYMASLGYQDNEGIVKTGYSKIFSGRVRLEAKLSKAFKFRINAYGSTRRASDKDYMLNTLRGIRPDIPPYNEDGSIFTEDPYTENPYTTLSNTELGTGESLSGIAELEWTILKGLIFTTSGNINYNNSQDLIYKRRGSHLSSNNGERTWDTYRNDTKIWNNTLVYANTFGKHDISAALTSSAERYQTLSYNMFAMNFPDDEVLNNFGSATTLGAMDEKYNANSMLSEIARVQYKFDERFLATLTFRADGSSKFGSGKRWGYFPSAGIGWTLSNEKFMKQGWIGRNLSHLKLRASYGKAGSQNLGYYSWMTLVGSGKYNESPAVVPSNIGNPLLQWEDTYMLDLAMEMEWWESRIRATAGYFNKKAENLMYDENLPPSSAFTIMTSNVASTQTNGFEFSLAVDVIRSRNALFTVDMNGSRNVSKVIKFNNSIKELVTPYTSNPRGLIKEGGVIGDWWGYKTYRRLFGTSEEVAALKGRAATGGQVTYRNPYESAGDIYFVDINGDGSVTIEDKTILGNAMPKLFGGFSFNLLLFQNWNLNMNFTYALGGTRFWQRPSEDVNNVGNYNHSNKIAGNSATLKSPYEATIPNMTPYGDGGNGEGNFNDFWLYDASHVRLNTLNLTYRMPSEWFADSFINAIDLSLQATNLFTLTKYPGFDPQGNFSPTTSMTNSMGIDYSFYPAARTFNFGVKFTFK